MDDHHDVIDLDDPPKDSTTDLSEAAKMYKALEEHLKAMETSKKPGFSAAAMCLVPGVVIPPKFKVPDFEKYKGLHAQRLISDLTAERWLLMLAMSRCLCISFRTVWLKLH